MMPPGVLKLREASVLSDLDVEFGRVLQRLARRAGEQLASPGVLLGAALASRAVQRGHVCLDLRGLDRRVLLDHNHEAVEVELPELKPWLGELEASPLVACVARPSDAGAKRSVPVAAFRPLVLDGAGRLYLWRYYDYQARLAQNLLDRRQPPAGHDQGGEQASGVDAASLARLGVDEATLRGSLARLFPKDAMEANREPNLQRVAALISVCSAFSVISGGPGTGKTTTVVKILAALVEQALVQGRRAPRILLLAPTGKAAQRLAESIASQLERLDLPAQVKSLIPTVASTIHRALGYQPRTPTRFRHGADEPMAADCVLVDESSMVDLALLTKLVEAVPRGARLILMGDKDQLSSVETGAILGDIFGPALSLQASGELYSPELVALAQRVTGDVLSSVDAAQKDRAVPIKNNQGQHPRVMRDCMVHLTRSYRYLAHSGIGGLARAINAGDSKQLIELVTAGSQDVRLVEGDQASLEEFVADQAVRCFSPYLRATTIEEKLALHAQARLLTPHRAGDVGVEALNQICERALLRAALIDPQRGGRGAGPGGEARRSVWYENQPILITQNEYQLELFNGDVGILQRDDAGQLRAWFPAARDGGAGRVRSVLPARLPPHETVFAMTVHKSQGSEFEQVLLVLPSKPSPVLTRELIYTAVTRAKRGVTIYGTREILAASVNQRVRRASGLSEALWGALPAADPALSSAQPAPDAASATLPSAPRKPEQLKFPF